ncbi:MAG: hemerythrin domain-containing protein [Polyangiaceae bacterium]|nr:hemerythrin domain-containing protein [Polyangiaceae bacterium]
MNRPTFKLDMSLMFAMHDALRRELATITKIGEKPASDAKRILKAASGWDLFKTILHIHHVSEDEALWPALAEAVADRPDDLALVRAMEAEHAAIDPLLEAIDAALEGDAASESQSLGTLTKELERTVTKHLEHEERDCLPLIDARISDAAWLKYGEVHGMRIGPNAPRVLPWLLDGAPEPVVTMVLGRLPEPARNAYSAAWEPAYAATDRWGLTAS